MNNTPSQVVRALLLLVVGALAGITANAALTITGTKYHQDVMFPEFNCYWDGGQYPTVCPNQSTGATVYVYVKNTGAGNETITDATLAGYSLASVIKRSTASWNPNGLNSIYFNWDNPPSDILDAGEPVWWKADPTTIAPGGAGQVAVRLRLIPTTSTVSVGVVTGGGSVTTNVTKDATAPQIQSIAYSGDRSKVYVHWRRAGGAVPTSILLDGTNVTSLTTTVGDSSLGIAASVINLTNALSHFSFHVFQGNYADGKTAIAGQRAWTNKFIYATYGAFDISGGYTEASWLNEANDHGFNNIQMNIAPIGAYMNTGAGEADALAQGYGYTILDPSKLCNFDPDMWFLNDEPELVEHNNYQNNCGTGLRIPCIEDKFPGSLAINEAVEHAATVRGFRPNVPTTVNLDGGLQPESFYNWGPAVDILQTDNYYEPRMRNAYENDLNKIPLYNNSRFSYAIGRTITAAGEPNPGHHLLYSTANATWPYPAWQSKRFEVYYTLAGGTRAGIGYWWLQGGYGMNNTDPDSQKLWKEVGLCGMEIRTVRDLLIKTTPLDNLTITQTPKVWAKAVASGTDSMILYVVNDNYTNAGNGYTYVTNIANATVTVTLPSWMLGAMSFEVTPGGLRAVSATVTNGNQIQFNLGTLTLTRMIVLTKNAQVPMDIQSRYISIVRPGICNFASAYCTNSAPLIVVPPQSQTVLVNSNANFFVTAHAYPNPTYQWRFNGGNISGATAASYTRTSAQTSHAGNYDVVISNSVGMVTSAVAVLTVSTNGFPPTILGQPSSQSVELGQNATFNVAADGTTPLSYRWRFNGSTISGATTSSYTRSNAQYTDAGNYDVVVTNTAGSITSSVATLTVTAPCVDPGLLNPSFELGNISGVATNWTGYQRSPNPTTVWTIQTASPPGGAGAQYQQVANTSSTGGGGVRQDITGCTVGATYSVSGWYRGNSANSIISAKVSPTASTSWATAVHLNPAATNNGSTWNTFSGTVVATGTSMTLWLDESTAGTGNNNVGCFDAIVVNCEQMPVSGPTITQQPSAANVCAGANASFTVAATGSGTLTYQWRTNGVNISNNSHYAGCTATTLWVTNVSSADAVNYSCVVTDSNGSTTSANAALTLKAATSITLQPAATNVCSGANATFTVAATGDGTVTYQWQKNTTNISNGGHYSGCTTATLTITGADSSDVANFRCVATAGCGSATSFQAALGLLTATSITAQPASQTACTGHDVQYSVTAAGSGTITYQWKTNGVNISNNSHYAGCTSSLLTVSNVTSADVVNYTCTATATCGSATSSSATLTLLSPTLLNPSFELSNISGVATNWTGYQRAPNPTTVWTIQTASPPAGTGTNYQQIANTSSTGGGGVRQDIKNCVIGATYTVAGWFRGNSALNSTCTVKVSPTASTSWATAINLSPAATFTGSTWTNFSGTVVATGTNMTLWLDGQTGSTGQNKAECFDGITVTCTP